MMEIRTVFRGSAKLITYRLIITSSLRFHWRNILRVSFLPEPVSFYWWTFFLARPVQETECFGYLLFYERKFFFSFLIHKLASIDEYFSNQKFIESARSLTFILPAHLFSAHKIPSLLCLQSWIEMKRWSRQLMSAQAFLHVATHFPSIKSYCL